jgi:hypothetical protein
MNDGLSVMTVDGSPLMVVVFAGEVIVLAIGKKGLSYSLLQVIKTVAK